MIMVGGQFLPGTQDIGTLEHHANGSKALWAAECTESDGGRMLSRMPCWNGRMFHHVARISIYIDICYIILWCYMMLYDVIWVICSTGFFHVPAKGSFAEQMKWIMWVIFGNVAGILQFSLLSPCWSGCFLRQEAPPSSESKMSSRWSWWFQFCWCCRECQMWPGSPRSPFWVKRLPRTRRLGKMIGRGELIQNLTGGTVEFYRRCNGQMKGNHRI